MELETTTQAHPAGVIAPLCLPEESGDAEMTTPPKPASSPDIKCLQDIPDTDADDASLLLDHKSSIVIIYITAYFELKRTSSIAGFSLKTQPRLLLLPTSFHSLTTATASL